MLNILVAPAEYTNKGQIIIKTIVKILKAEHQEYSVFFSNNFEEYATNVATLKAQGETTIVVLGDDYCVDKFLTQYGDLSKIKVGIIPITHNSNFAKYIGLPFNPINALNIILENKTQNFDYMVMNDKVVINSILIGAYAQLFELYSKSKIKNTLMQKLITDKNLSQIGNCDLVIDFKSGTPKKESVFEMSICNGGVVNKKNVSPLANVQDGYFNLNYSVDLTVDTRKKYYKLFSSGCQIYRDNTKQHWSNAVKILSPKDKVYVCYDGATEMLDSLDVKIVENGLSLFYPPKPQQ